KLKTNLPMMKITKKIYGIALALTCGLAATLKAQNLYVSNEGYIRGLRVGFIQVVPSGLLKCSAISQMHWAVSLTLRRYWQRCSGNSLPRTKRQTPRLFRKSTTDGDK